MIVWWAPLHLADVRLDTLLDETELARLGRTTRQADRARWLLGAAVLRLAVAAETGTDPLSVRIDRTCADCGAQHGRPRVVTPAGSGLYVSVSHSGLVTAVAVGHEPLGIDVQRAGTDAWVRREAAFKSGLEAPVFTVLHPPVRDHVAVLAHGPHVTVVDERDAAALLPR
ncbi:4'-phosphopantetheinyl transferase family protein [Propionibacteriaceae bacterium G1746]|uniref:4'-phosphopantetheinyl transferase family protein n=1 Tax=Aestuariimicrobium sp. G57 TaxID=3418485 RepID=UPI003C150023